MTQQLELFWYTVYIKRTTYINTKPAKNGDKLNSIYMCILCTHNCVQKFMYMEI